MFSSVFGPPAHIQEAVDNVTSEMHNVTDYGGIMAICDEINRDVDGGKDYARAMVKRLNSKNPRVLTFTLDLVEACVKNCGRRFHEQVHKNDFLGAVVKVGTQARSKDVRDKALKLVLEWAEAFAKRPEFPGFFQRYQVLRQQGIEFPARDMSAMAPVFTPPTNPAVAVQQHEQQQQQQHVTPGRPAPVPAAPAPHRQQQQPMYPSEWASVNPTYVAKIKSDLLEAYKYIELAVEMLSADDSVDAKQGSEALLGLVNVVAEIQARIFRLIVEVTEEEVVDLSLQVNEHLSTVVEWHRKLMRNEPFKVHVLEPPPALLDNNNNSIVNTDMLPAMDEIKIESVSPAAKQKQDNNNGGEQQQQHSNTRGKPVASTATASSTLDSLFDASSDAREADGEADTTDPFDELIAERHGTTGGHTATGTGTATATVAVPKKPIVDDGEDDEFLSIGERKTAPAPKKSQAQAQQQPQPQPSKPKPQPKPQEIKPATSSPSSTGPATKEDLDDLEVLFGKAAAVSTSADSHQKKDANDDDVQVTDAELDDLLKLTD